MSRSVMKIALVCAVLALCVIAVTADAPKQAAAAAAEDHGQKPIAPLHKHAIAAAKAAKEAALKKSIDLANAKKKKAGLKKLKTKKQKVQVKAVLVPFDAVKVARFYKDFTVEALSKIAKAQKLATKGTKSDLIARIVKFEEKQYNARVKAQEKAAAKAKAGAQKKAKADAKLLKKKGVKLNKKKNKKKKAKKPKKKALTLAGFPSEDQIGTLPAANETQAGPAVQPTADEFPAGASGVELSLIVKQDLADARVNVFDGNIITDIAKATHIRPWRVKVEKLAPSRRRGYTRVTVHILPNVVATSPSPDIVAVLLQSQLTKKNSALRRGVVTRKLALDRPIFATSLTQCKDKSFSRPCVNLKANATEKEMLAAARRKAKLREKRIKGAIKKARRDRKRRLAKKDKKKAKKLIKKANKQTKSKGKKAKKGKKATKKGKKAKKAKKTKKAKKAKKAKKTKKVKKAKKTKKTKKAKKAKKATTPSATKSVKTL